MLPRPDPSGDKKLSPKPPSPRQARRLSISFRKINQAVGSITHVDIFTGSLTGTSERLASSLAEKAAKRGAVVTLQSLDKFNPQCFDDPNGPYHSTSRVNVFVVSTHFAGGPSPNAEAFSQWLKLASSRSSISPSVGPVLPDEVKSSATTGRRTIVGISSPVEAESKPIQQSANVLVRKPSDNAPTSAPVTRPRRQTSFSAAIRPIIRMTWKSPFGNDSAGTAKAKSSMHGVQYAVFGVGNSMYLTYNAMAKFVDARLQIFGAVRVCPLGLGDVTDDVDSSFSKWETQLLDLLACQNPGPPVSIALVSKTQVPRRSTELPPVKPVLEYSAASNSSQSEDSSQAVQHVAQATSTNVLSTETTAFSVNDIYGRRVRLRFRCRTIAKIDDDPAPNIKLPPVGLSNNKAIVLLRSLSAMRRDATHIRYPCVVLQSISMLKRTIPCVSCTSSPSAFKEVALIRLGILDPDLSFRTGDTFGYYPQNALNIVDAVGLKLGLDMDALVELSFSDEGLPSIQSEQNTSSASGSASSRTSSRSSSSTPTFLPAQSKNRHLPFPSPCTVRTILRDFLELRTISREFVRVASGFVSDPREHELLENITSIDSSAAFNREFACVKSGLLKLLDMAPSLHLPFEVLVNITPLLKPRLYSIASSHRKNDREFDIVVALGAPDDIHGLSVSNFRRILTSPDVEAQQTDGGNAPPPVKAMLRGFVASSRFKTPPNLSSPMIMIANGIGIAPLRALLQDREIEFDKEKNIPASRERLSSSTPSSKNLLFFGCSNKASLVFESELREWEDKALVELHIAYSCEPGHDRQHVQDAVAAQIDQIAALMSIPDARIYICGKAGMARAVHQLLAASGAENTADNWYEKALVSGRYIESIAD